MMVQGLDKSRIFVKRFQFAREEEDTIFHIIIKGLHAGPVPEKG